MTNFHPFFLECAKQEVDNDRKKQLENLAIWKRFGDNESK